MSAENPVVSSRLARDARGRLVVEIVVPRTPGEQRGDRLLVVGNTFEAGAARIGFLEEKTGRLATAADAVTPPGRTGTRRETWPADYPHRARQLHAQGLSCPKVAAELSVPFATAKSWIWPNPNGKQCSAARVAD